MTERNAVVSGLGVVTPVGVGVEESFARLREGTSGAARIDRFPVDTLRTQIAACVRGVDALPALERTLHIARVAAEEALAAAALGPDRTRRLELVLAAPPAMPGVQEWCELARDLVDGEEFSFDPGLAPRAPRPAAERLNAQGSASWLGGALADALGIERPPTVLTTACASGATAIALGLQALRRGRADAVLVVGADANVTQDALIRFSLLGTLSMRNDDPSAASRPFERDRDGFVLAEGAGALVLESPEAARERGAGVLGQVLGAGEAVDTFHRTRSEPSGAPMAECMRRALADASVGVADVGYVNAHGTATRGNDVTEAKALATVLAGDVGRVPVSSTKSMLGHSLSAAGAVEGVLTLEMLRRHVLLPTINHAEADPDISLDVVPNEARETRAQLALSNSFGFGGQNVSLVFGAAPGR